MRLTTFILVASASLFAQQLPDPKTIFASSADLAKKSRTYQYESEMTIEMEMGSKPMTMTFTTSVAGINPDRMRIDSKSQMGATTIVSDGQYTWTYVAALKQYSKKAALRGPDSLLESLGLRNTANVSSVLDSARTVRAESLEIGGERRDCWVVQLNTDSFPLPFPPGARLASVTMTTWIDKLRGITLRMQMSGEMQGGPMPKPVPMKQTLALRSMRFDEPVPDSLFAFTPPADAREVPEIGATGPKKQDIIGKPAPPFRVQSIDGVTYDSAELKGKAVLLDFWATWCAPCRKDMPVVERLYGEFKDRGLIVIGLNVGEEREVVEKFVKQNKPAYPIALTSDSPAVAAFEVNAFPTYVLIGADGSILPSRSEAKAKPLYAKWSPRRSCLPAE